MYLRQSCSHGSQWIKPFYNHASLKQRAPNTCTWDFPDVIKFRVAAQTISEKAIRFRHPDYNPDRAQKVISSCMSDICRHATFHPNPCTRFWVILLTDRQTDRQTNKRTRANAFTSSFARGNNIIFLIFPALVVMSSLNVVLNCKVFSLQLLQSVNTDHDSVNW